MSLSELIPSPIGSLGGERQEATKRASFFRFVASLHDAFLGDACTLRTLPIHLGGLVHHSGRGSQYLSICYTERLAEARIEPSVSSVGDSYDNALAEMINGLYKAEVIHRLGPWKSIQAVEWGTIKWVDWFNNRCLLEPIGNIPPAEAEEQYYVQIADLDRVS